METSSASIDRVAKLERAVARAIVLDRTPRRVATRLLARLAARLVGRDGVSRWPNALVWRVRNFIHATPPAIALFPASGGGTDDARRVLLVSHDLSASGAPQLLVEIGQILRRAGVLVTAIAPSDGPTRAGLVAAGVTVIVDPAVARPDAPLLALLAEQTEVALCNTVDAAGAVAALAPAVPVIWYLHEVSVLAERLAGTVLPTVLRRPARVWAGSEVTAELLRATRPDVRVLPYGLDSIGQGVPPGQRRILRLGVFASYEPRKGQDLLLAALDLLSPEALAQIEVHFYGRVLFADFHRALLSAAARAPKVKLYGAVDRPSYIAAMLDCDAVVIPSRSDSLPLVSLDALGCGRVLICTAETGTAAYLTSATDGFVAAGADPAAIAATLELAIAHRAEWPTIADRGRQVFAKAFSANAFAAAITGEIAVLAPATASTGPPCTTSQREDNAQRPDRLID